MTMAKKVTISAPVSPYQTQDYYFIKLNLCTTVI